jgi:steroid 5-alpha reductase family enzyme
MRADSRVSTIGDYRTLLGRNCASKAVEPMSVEQTTGLVLLLVGLAALSVSVGVAWILSRLTRDGRVDGIWFISAVSLLLFLVGIALCWFGVSNIIEGGA